MTTYTATLALLDEHEAAVRDHVRAALDRLERERGIRTDAMQFAARVDSEQHSAKRHVIAWGMESGDMNAVLRSEIARYRELAERSRGVDQQQEREAA